MNKRAFSILLLAFSLLSWPTLAAPAICHLEDEPAATLLLPYFEVDLNNPGGVTTLFSINNAEANDLVAHVEIWSDLAVALRGFDIYLKGFDVQTINLRDILLDGRLPQTGPAPLASFPGCVGLIPPQNLSPTNAQCLRLELTGKPSPCLGGLVAGRDLGGNVARGYVTVDVLNQCDGVPPSSHGPTDLGYFGSGGTGVASNRNALWGDYFYVAPNENFAQGETLVHIHADGTDPETSAAGEYTFYGRHVNWTAADNREPLATRCAVRFLNGGAFTGGTQLIVWRDPKVNQGPFVGPVMAGVRPAWFPLGHEGIVAFDEQGNADVLPSQPLSPAPLPTPFPAAAQKIRVDDPTLPLSFDFGLLHLDLDTTVTPAVVNPPEDPAASQAFVTAVMDANGRFSVGFDAVQLDSACDSGHP